MNAITGWIIVACIDAICMPGRQTFPTVEACVEKINDLNRIATEKGMPTAEAVCIEYKAPESQ